MVQKMDLIQFRYICGSMKQGGGSVMIWDEIVDQQIIGPFKFDEKVKLNSANYTYFMNKIFFFLHGTSLSLAI